MFIVVSEFLCFDLPLHMVSPLVKIRIWKLDGAGHVSLDWKIYVFSRFLVLDTVELEAAEAEIVAQLIEKLLERWDFQEDFSSYFFGVLSFLHEFFQNFDVFLGLS